MPQHRKLPEAWRRMLWLAAWYFFNTTCTPCPISSVDWNQHKHKCIILVVCSYRNGWGLFWILKHFPFPPQARAWILDATHSRPFVRISLQQQLQYNAAKLKCSAVQRVMIGSCGISSFLGWATLLPSSPAIRKEFQRQWNIITPSPSIAVSPVGHMHSQSR